MKLLLASHGGDAMQSHMVEEGRLRASLATAHEPRTPSGAQEGAGSMASEWKGSLVSPRAGLYSRMKKGNAGSTEDGDFFASFFSDFFPLPLLPFDHVLFACAPLSGRRVCSRTINLQKGTSAKKGVCAISRHYLFRQARSYDTSQLSMQKTRFMTKSGAS